MTRSFPTRRSYDSYAGLISNGLLRYCAYNGSIWALPERQRRRIEADRSNSFLIVYCLVTVIYRTLFFFFLLFQCEIIGDHFLLRNFDRRSEEHTSELQSLMRISYHVFFLKK